MSQPNIIFLMTDEQRWDTFSYNNPAIKTPHLDALIGESVFFKHAYCSNPSCVPSRAAIVTGKHPTACACPTFISKLPAEQTTFMTKLQQVGYTTAVVGKQHFAGSEIYHGYDFEEIVDGHFPTAKYKAIAPYADYLAQEGVDPAALVQAGEAMERTWTGDVKHHIDWFIGEEGKRWLKNHHEASKGCDAQKPWVFTLSFPGPHQPYDALGTPYADWYKAEDMPDSPSCAADLAQKPPHYQTMKQTARMEEYPKEVLQKTKQSYYANMSLIDEKIGEVVALLKELGEYDNTMILYSSDHGDFMGDYGLVAKAQYLCDSLMRVPLFIKPPLQSFKGFEVADYVTNIDIASTCLHVAHAPELIGQNMENHPYHLYWQQDQVTPADYLFMEAHDLKGTIENEIKVIYYVNRPYGEIYDLKDDPYERINLWDNPNYQDAKMRAMTRIIDRLFAFSPSSEMEWNTGAPKI